MASTIIIFTVSLLVALTNAGFVWQDDDDDDSFGQFPFQPMYGPPPPPLPPFPKIPGLNLPQPPPLPMFNPPVMPPFPTFQMPTFKMPNFHMPTFKPLEIPPLPTVDDIKNTKPKPGQVYNGVYVSSHTDSKYDKDGNIIRDGGGTILVNNNGDVIEEQFGNPSSTDTPKVVPMPPFEMPPFHHHSFMKPIDPGFIRDTVPKGKGHFSGVSTSSHSFSSDINGVKSSGGGVNSIINDDGKVDEKTIEYTNKDV